MTRKERFIKIFSALNDGLTEREEVLFISLLSALAGQNFFLYGPPGTAKSLISRRLAKVFETKVYFDYLMQRFSAPEDVFGPVSLQRLKNDEYVRNTEGFLPEADVAFLDEIWKSSPAILNTLLTIINEKVFKNGNVIQRVPLKFLIAASNELPVSNQGLDALYDRFLTRVIVGPVTSLDTFGEMILRGRTHDHIKLDDYLRVSDAEFKIWQKEMDNVTVSSQVMDVLLRLREAIKDPVYISDRRWQRCVYLIKALAYFSDRTETELSDCFVLPYCLWDKPEDKPLVDRLICRSLLEAGPDLGPMHLNLKEIVDSLLIKESIYNDVVTKEGALYFEYRIPEDESAWQLAASFFDHRSRYDKDHELLIPVSKIGDENWTAAYVIDSWGDNKLVPCHAIMVCHYPDGYLYLTRLIDGYNREFYGDWLRFKPSIQQRKGDYRALSIDERRYLIGCINSANVFIGKARETKDRVLVSGALLPDSIRDSIITLFDQITEPYIEFCGRCQALLDKYSDTYGKATKSD